MPSISPLALNFLHWKLSAICLVTYSNFFRKQLDSKVFCIHQKSICRHVRRTTRSLEIQIDPGILIDFDGGKGLLHVKHIVSNEQAIGKKFFAGNGT